MNLTFKKLTQENALIIANNWKYEEPYSFYDMTENLEDYNEFIDEELRNNGYYFETHLNNELIGFFVLNIENEEIEIGLGLKPEFCGKKLGKDFLEQIISYINTHFSYKILSLSVAAFNERAIKVYKSCGFKQEKEFIQETNGGKFNFIKLIKVI